MDNLSTSKKELQLAFEEVAGGDLPNIRDNMNKKAFSMMPM